MKKRIMCAILAALMLLSAVGCSTTTAVEDTAEDTTSAASDVADAAAEEAVEEEEVRLEADVPDKDYDGATFGIYVSSNAEYGDVKDDFTSEEMTGEPINDARFTRNTTTEEKLNIKLAVTAASSTGSDVGRQAIANAVTAGVTDWSIAMCCGYATSTLAQQGYLYDLFDVPYLDLTQAYWDQKCTTDLPINNKLYYTTGDISTADNEATYCIMFNKQLITDMNLDNPYELVTAGTWTIDKFAEMVTNVSADLDGDGDYDSDDRFGALIWDDSIMGVVNATGDKCCTVNPDTGALELTLYTDKVVSILEKYFVFAEDKTVSMAYQRTNWDDTLLGTMFMGNQALFITQLLQMVPKLREMECDFGIVPFYKYDAEQESYYNTVGSWHSVFFCVPASQADVEMTGIVSQVLACESLYTVTPAYYDQTLKGKVSRDEESSAMLDIIFNTRVYDLGWYYAIGGYNEGIMNLFRNYTTDFTSLYQKSTKIANKTLEKVNKAFGITE